MIHQYQWGLVDVELNPTRGSEQAGRRPALVVSNEPFNQAMPVLTILPLTATERQLYPAEVFLPKHSAGQRADSIIMAHQIRTVSKQRVRGILGYLSDPLLRQQVRRALREHLALGE